MVQGINFENNMAKRMAKEGLTKSVGKTALGKTIAGYTPFVGDTIDIGTGIYNIGHGHPWVGGAQALMGVGGLGLDTAALLAAPYTGGASIAGEQILKQAARQAIKQGGKKLIKYASKAPIKGSAGRFATSMGLEVIPFATRNSSNTNDTTDTNTNSNNQGGSQQQGGQSYGNRGVDPIAELIKNATANQVPMDVYDDVRGMDIPTLGSAQQPTVDNKQVDINSILQAYQAQQQELNKPYIDALQNYINNYGDYMKGSRNAQRFYTALAGLSGNQGYKDLAKQYDPNEMELNRIKLVKALQEAKAGNVGNINEIIGNMAIAQEMGLSPEAALANKNLLNAFTTQQKAQYGLQGRMYGADRSYNARIYEANLDNATKKAIANGRIDLALQLQQMKGNVSRTNALINAASFGATPEDVQAMLDYFRGGASPAKGLTKQGTAQPTKKQVNTVGGLFGD